MFKVSILPLFVLALILSVVLAASDCYCVNCSGQRCNPANAATYAVWKEAAGIWQMSSNRDKNVVYVPEDDQWVFHKSCKSHGAMGVCISFIPETALYYGGTVLLRDTEEPLVAQ
ncbi:hypothetical protein BGZ67_006088 [Mortierella alpina]|nr:hypothetical protein BGZ67_006088 [Mortierella alpina]